MEIFYDGNRTKVVAAFNSLSLAEQREVVAEIVRGFEGAGELEESGLHELADELFRGYDAEEAARAGVRHRV